MDPNANLEEQLKLARDLLKQIDTAGRMPSAVSTGRLCDLVIALDEWIRKGGFLPATWAATRKIFCCAENARGLPHHESCPVALDCPHCDAKPDQAHHPECMNR